MNTMNTIEIIGCVVCWVGMIAMIIWYFKRKPTDEEIQRQFDRETGQRFPDKAIKAIKIMAEFQKIK